MLFRDRVDGKRVRNLPAFNAVMPYLMRGRNESAVWFSKDIDVENAIHYARRKNAEQGGSRYSLFGVVLAAAVRTVALKPRLNRFVHRRGVYQRNELSLSFIVRKKQVTSAEEANAKIRFDPSDTLDEAISRIEAAIDFARGGVPGPDDLEVEIAHRIPGGKALVTAAFRLLDRFNIAPAWMIRNDPLFTSIYFANLGSIGLDTPFHHLYEWGSASMFVVMGRMIPKDIPRTDGSPARRRFINFKVSIDERVGEGLYFAHAASLFERLLSRPELLEERPDLATAEA
jgi:hypothetical protein